jgi:hypothetical protein
MTTSRSQFYVQLRNEVILCVCLDSSENVFWYTDCTHNIDDSHKKARNLVQRKKTCLAIHNCLFLRSSESKIDRDNWVASAFGKAGV